MGCKKCAAIAAVTFLFCCCTLTVHAEPTAVDLYKFYDKSYTLVYPDGILDTISRYSYSKKYKQMYHFVSLSDYDSTLVDNDVNRLTQEVTRLEETLRNGYSMSKEDIYALEDLYCTTKTDLDLAKSRSLGTSVEAAIPTIEAPTYSEYIDALNIKSEIESLADIGVVVSPMPFPSSTVHTYDTSDGNTFYFIVASGANVKALWNGKVLSVDDSRILISCNNDILLGYSGLATVNVKQGDTIYQGQILGTSSDRLGLRLSLNGSFVDVSKLFLEE